MHRIHLSLSQDVMNLVLEAAEAFSVSGIKRCSLLTEAQREVLLNAALNPLTLKHMSRLTIRHCLGNMGPLVISKIRQLPIPNLIKQFLLYEV